MLKVLLEPLINAGNLDLSCLVLKIYVVVSLSANVLFVLACVWVVFISKDLLLRAFKGANRSKKISKRVIEEVIEVILYIVSLFGSLGVVLRRRVIKKSNIAGVKAKVIWHKTILFLAF